ncbi:MAG: thiamine phosphate synthase, partial [Planctomycetales bacterium]
ANVGMIQLREKCLDDRMLLERAHDLREVTSGQSLFIMNDRPDLAVLSRADGVHVGQTEMSVKDVRQIIGADRLIGVSTHSLVQAKRAVLDGANYIGVGPTFPSRTKVFDEFPGLDLLAEVAAEIRLPAFAIGGINLQNASEVLAVGFQRLAVGSAIASADNPKQVASRLIEMTASAYDPSPS